MSRGVALASAIATLSACSASESASDCASRFARIEDRFPGTTSPLTADFIFQASGQNSRALKSITKMTIVSGDGSSALALFSKGDFDAAGSVIMADGKALVGMRQSARTAQDAVRQGCSLEDRYGTLRNIRLANPAAPSIDTKNEQ
ncbi:hypothetical protein ASE86_08340 [Sphingomonas sp. Leaf33]|uniref:hypothetical protein n=1 Tax=Sphingomonas sp. Leaf33 TaxID=1736215 RepID=UPI0006F25DAB|nr:hypothetical protein [Sphingomonas sp. Leaf33]KQN26152.1 hypothetical protein ASE86_08340 [Sphingomonas sp. Leaf33]